jgi:hypothetical protein
MVRRWVRLCAKRLQKDPHYWDQAALRDIVMREKKAKILPMPLSYSKIYDLDFLFIEQSEVIVEHYQASRRFKDAIH